MSYPLTLKIVWCDQVMNIEVQSTDTIGQIKFQIELAWNVPQAEQILHISSQRMLLHDDKTLAEYGIITDATIDFLMRVEDPT